LFLTIHKIKVMATAISIAIGSNRESRVSGYQINKGNFNLAIPNLPQQIAILAEANHANQGTIPLASDGVTPAPFEVTSAAQAAATFGYGSPIHHICRILFPIYSSGIGLPVVVFPQLEGSGASAWSQTLTITGTPTTNATHYLNVNGRESLDFQSYAVSIVSTDTDTTIAAKYVAAISAVLGAPVTAANTAGVITFTSKWFGLTANEISITVDTNGNANGLTYAQNTATAAVGTPVLTGSFGLFGGNWYTNVINSYGYSVPATLGLLEQFNGVPDPVNPTGLWSPTVFTPFMAFFGDCKDTTVSALTAITDAAARRSQCTNVLCPAPASSGFSWEAAANIVMLFAPKMQNTPYLDINNQSYPDMPVPVNQVIGDESIYNNRDLLVQKGCSTVTLENGAYVVQDLVTTYHPTGEVPLQFSYCRNLNVDWNIKDAYGIAETLYVKDHVIIADGLATSLQNAIKPSEWKADIFDLLDTMEEDGLITNAAFSKASVQVQVDPNNPNRFNTVFNYMRTGIARIESTTVYAGFNN